MGTNSFYDDDLEDNLYSTDIDGYGLTEYGEGSEDLFEDEVEIEDGEGNFSLPIQKNAEVDEVKTTLEAKEPVLSPELEVDGEGVWRFPEEHGRMNRQESFVEGKELTFELDEGDGYDFELLLPESSISEGFFELEREVGEGDELYDLSLYLDDEEIWSRSMEDDLFGPMERWAEGSNYRSVDHILLDGFEGLDRIFAVGNSTGTVEVRDASTGELLSSVTPTEEEVNEVIFVPGEWGDGNMEVNGLILDDDGDLFLFTFFYDLEDGDHQIDYELVEEDITPADFILRSDLTGDGWEDVITFRNEDILVGYNDGTGFIDDFTVMEDELSGRVDEASITPWNQLLVGIDDRDERVTHLEVFEYEDGNFTREEYEVLDQRTSLVRALDFTGDGEMEYITRTRFQHHELTIWGTDPETGNMTRLREKELDYRTNHLEVGDINGNGFYDFVTTSYLDRATGIFLNQDGEEFEEEFNYDLDARGRYLLLKDLDGTDDLDIMVATSFHVDVALNRRNWTAERITGLADPIQSYIDGADEDDIEYDFWGNPMATVPFTLHSEYGGTFTLKNPNIRYDYSPTVDITESVESYLEDVEGSELGWVDVPATLTAEDDVKFTIETTITYESRGPLMHEPIPSTYDLLEGESVQHLIDLSDYFYDPMGYDITYEITHQEDREKLSARVDGSYLNFESKAGTGAFDFRVRATNDDGYRQESNTFSVNVLPQPPTMDLPDKLSTRQDVTTWYDLSEYISGLEEFEEYEFSSDSEHITVHQENLSIELFYEQADYVELVTFTLEAGGHVVEDTVEIEVVPYDAPFFRPLPDITIEMNVVLEPGDSTYLPDYVDHPELDSADFDYGIEDQDDDDMNVGVEDGYIVAHPLEDHHGSSEVTARVDHGDYHDLASFTFTVNQTRYPPEYVGDLEDTVVLEGESWSVDLNEQFDYAEPWRLLFEANHPDIEISHSTATWEPEFGVSDDIDGLVFTARDMEYPELQAESPPIDLTFEWENQPPEYIGGLYSRVVHPNTTWEVNLFDHFTDREDPYGMTFSVSHEEIEIENGNASWTATEDSSSLRDVVFTAHDAEDHELTAESSPIHLIVPTDEEGPFAWIEHVSAYHVEEGTEIEFIGATNKTQGNVSYEWRSDRDGFLSEEKQFTTTLSPGTHNITFRVRDDRGRWSSPDTVEIIVEEKEEQVDRYLLHLGIIFMIVGLSFVYIAQHFKSRRRVV